MNAQKFMNLDKFCESFKTYINMSYLCQLFKVLIEYADECLFIHVQPYALFVV